MGSIQRSTHKLVFPDGLVQDLENPPNLAEGDLLSSERAGISSEPAGKYWVLRIEASAPGSYPHECLYYVERF